MHGVKVYLLRVLALRCCDAWNVGATVRNQLRIHELGLVVKVYRRRLEEGLGRGDSSHLGLTPEHLLSDSLP